MWNCRTTTTGHKLTKPVRQLRQPVPPSKTTVRQRELQDARIAKKPLAGIDQARAQIAAAEAGREAVSADLVRAHSSAAPESLYQTHSATKQKVEAAVRTTAPDGAAREPQRRSQTAETMFAQQRTHCGSERRSKAVLESQDTQLQADLHANRRTSRQLW